MQEGQHLLRHNRFDPEGPSSVVQASGPVFEAAIIIDGRAGRRRPTRPLPGYPSRGKSSIRTLTPTAGVPAGVNRRPSIVAGLRSRKLSPLPSPARRPLHRLAERIPARQPDAWGFDDHRSHWIGIGVELRGEGEPAASARHPSCQSLRSVCGSVLHPLGPPVISRCC